MKMINRFIEEIIARKLKIMGAVQVAGPKFCGKTTTCKKFAKSQITLSNTQDIINATIKPETVLLGEYPHLIDEWQQAPDIWNYIKTAVDEDFMPGKFLLTGSSTPADLTQIYHNGAGRIATIKMKPLTLAESNESNSSVSLSQLFNDSNLDISKAINFKKYDDILFYMCRGGWPLSVLCENKSDALEMTQSYCSNLFKFENSKNAKYRNKNPNILRILLKSCARNISCPVKATTIINDIVENQERETFNRKTYDEYILALADLYILDTISSWNPNLRSKTSIISAPVMHFTDTSVACYAIDANPENLKFDSKTAGLLFEDFAIRDLSVYLSLLNGEIKHFRDNNGLECDAVLLLRDGRWASVEIKLGGKDLEEEGIKNLIKFNRNIETLSNYSKPAFSMVITAFGQPRKSKEGIYVVPITCLGK